jgi:hypothetical protein
MIRASQIAETDPPEVGYLLIMATRVEGSIGAKSD